MAILQLSREQTTKSVVDVPSFMADYYFMKTFAAQKYNPQLIHWELSEAPPCEPMDYLRDPDLENHFLVLASKPGS
jgi:hypothetical protein